MENTKAKLHDLEDLHRILAEELRRRIQSDDAKPADFANAIKFLKDNGIEADLSDDTDVQDIMARLPFPEE